MPPARMVPPVADGESSTVPTSNEGETPAEVVEFGVGVAVQESAMDVGALSAVEEPDEVEPKGAFGADPHEDDEAVEPEDATPMGAESDDEYAEEDPEEEEENEETSDEEAVMEPLSVLKPGAVQAVVDEENKETSKVDVEVEEAGGEEPDDDIKGLLDVSTADGVNEKNEGEHVNRRNKYKGEAADISSNSDDAGGSGDGDMQNSELAGGLELLVDELPKNCVEEDIAMVFSKCGEIKSVRIVRNSSTEKSKDIAFVCYASIEAANMALNEFKKGAEVKGIKIRVSACQDNYTLFLGNICKSWTKDQVLTALNNIGIQECDVKLPTGYKGKNRGFAFLTFGSHYYARAAFRRLMKPDTTFGIDGRVTVSFNRKRAKPSNDLMEAKRVYLEHVPLSWNDDKIKECCEEYGKILSVDLFQISKNMKSETFSFVEFSSSKSALACVEGINNAKIVDGSLKLSACLARPKNCATSEGATTPKTENVSGDKNPLQKIPKGIKGKLNSQAKEVVVKKNAPSKLLKDSIISQDAAEVQQTSKPSEGKSKLGKNKNSSGSQRPSKKLRNGNVDGSNLTTYQSAAVPQTSNSSKGKKKPGKDVNTYIDKRPLKKAHKNRNVRQPNRSRGTEQPSGPQYSRADRGLGESSRSKAYASDLEPHAGCIPPANQVPNTHIYDQRRIRRYDIHPIDVHPYARETAPSRSTYSEYRSHAPYQTGYEYVYPPPTRSGSYYSGGGRFVTRRGDY